jgi:hypothetical protein
MKRLKREINLKWKPYIISFIVCFLMSLVGLILSAATWDTPRQKAQANIDRDFDKFKNATGADPKLPPEDEFSKSWFGECLRVHNNYRSQLENIKDGSSVPGLSWSNDLAKDAFTWARHLADRNSGLEHSTTFGHGENLYSSTNGPKNCEPAISAFFNEYSLYHNEKIGEGDFSGYGHFTQVNCAFKHLGGLAIFSKAWLCLCGQSKYEIHRLPL